VLNEAFRLELIAMRREDLKVRQELVESGELDGTYVPRMEAVHIRNAERLKELVVLHGWPDETSVGKDGAEAAWLIVQHAIGNPAFQRQCLGLMQESAKHGKIPLWHAAYLEDRIAMYEGRSQRYGTQWLDDLVDGRARPWKLEDSDRVNEFRARVGLEPMHPVPEPGPALPLEQQESIRRDRHWWEQWLAGKGWQPSLPFEN